MCCKEQIFIESLFLTFISKKMRKNIIFFRNLNILGKNESFFPKNYAQTSENPVTTFSWKKYWYFVIMISKKYQYRDRDFRPKSTNTVIRYF